VTIQDGASGAFVAGIESGAGGPANRLAADRIAELVGIREHLVGGGVGILVFIADAVGDPASRCAT